MFFDNPATVVFFIVRIIAVVVCRLFAFCFIRSRRLADLLAREWLFARARVWRGGDFWPIDGDGFPVSIDLSHFGDTLQLEVHFANTHLAHRFAGFFLNDRGWHAVVDDRGVIFGDVVVHDFSFVVNDRDVLIMHAVAVQAAMPQIGVVTVGVVMMTQSEVESDAYSRTVPHVTDTGHVIATGR